MSNISVANCTTILNLLRCQAEGDRLSRESLRFAPSEDSPHSRAWDFRETTNHEKWERLERHASDWELSCASRIWRDSGAHKSRAALTAFAINLDYSYVWRQVRAIEEWQARFDGPQF